MIVRLILSFLICLLLPPLLASFISLGGANIGVVELTLLYIIVTGCVIYSWRYSKRKKNAASHGRKPMPDTNRHRLHHLPDGMSIEQPARPFSPWFRHALLADARRSAQPTSPPPSRLSRGARNERPESKPPTAEQQTRPQAPDPVS